MEGLNYWLDWTGLDWIEAIKFLVEENLLSNPNLNIINECIGDEDDKEVTFKISNNTLSSSILELI